MKSVEPIFLKRFSAPNLVALKTFSRDTLEYLLKHNWPGNVRELENTIERAVVLSTEGEIQLQDFLIDDSESAAAIAVPPEVSLIGKIENTVVGCVLLEEVVKLHILKVLDHNRGAKDKTAKMLGIDRKTLYRKLSEYGRNEDGENQQGSFRLYNS